MSVLVLLLTGALALVALGGTARTALAVLLATFVLLPSSLVLPASPTAVLTVPRVIEAAALLGVLLRRGAPLRPAPRTPVVVVPLLAYLAVLALTGVGWAPRPVDPVAAAYLWVGQAEQVLVLVLVLVLARQVRSRVLLCQVAVVATVAGVLYLLEAVTGQSFARLLYRASPDQLGSVPASVLERRDGALRVRGAADFALEGGWLLAATVPLVCVWAADLARRGRRSASALAACLVPLLVFAVFLTRSRSATAVALLVAAGLLLVLAPRRPSSLLAGIAVVFGAAVALGPVVVDAFTNQATAGSAQVRLERLPEVLGLVAARPLRGVGLTGIQQVGFAGVDSSYVQVYVEAGAIAVALLVVALVALLVGVLRALWLPRAGDTEDDRLLALGAGAALVTLVVAAAAFDLFTAGSFRLFWWIGAAGLVAAERLGAVPVRRSPNVLLSPLRWALVLAAVAGAVVVRLVVPTQAATEVVFATMDPRAEAADDPVGLGRQLVRSLCGVARQVTLEGGADVASCLEKGPPGWGVLRVEAPQAFATDLGVRTVLTSTGNVPALRYVRVAATAASPAVGVPNAVRVAPAVVGVWGVSLLLLLPPAPRDAVRRRRRENDSSDEREHESEREI